MSFSRIFSIISTLLVLFLLVGCLENKEQAKTKLNSARVVVSPPHQNPRCVEVDDEGECVFYALSIYELLASPMKYHGKIIALGGYVNFSHEGNALYATEEHYLNRLTRDAVWINVEGLNLGEHDDFRRGYAYIRGKYDQYDGGHFRLFSGAINNVDKFEPIIKLGAASN